MLPENKKRDVQTSKKVKLYLYGSPMSGKTTFASGFPEPLILNTDGKSFSRPWFGQLMTGPQLMAYLCQVNMWLETYKPEIEI